MPELVSKSKAWTVTFSFSTEPGDKHLARVFLSRNEPKVHQEIAGTTTFPRKQLAKASAAQGAVDWLVANGHIRVDEKNHVVGAGSSREEL